MSTGNLDDFEATHSLEEIKRMAREKGISTAGTKREIASRVPQVIEEYSWQHLERQPYGLALWDAMLLDGALTVVFMAREARADVERLPNTVQVHWKVITLGRTIDGHRVMPVVVMAYFIPLQTIYEVWFNFYGEAGAAVQEAFMLLGNQSTLYLFFYDRGPEPVRKFGFSNSLATSFHGHYGMLKAIPEWTDSDFDAVKRQLMDQYTGEQLWRMK